MLALRAASVMRAPYVAAWLCLCSLLAAPVLCQLPATGAVTEEAPLTVTGAAPLTTTGIVPLTVTGAAPLTNIQNSPLAITGTESLVATAPFTGAGPAAPAALLATYPPIVSDPKARPPPVAPAPGDAAALAAALGELAAAAGPNTSPSSSRETDAGLTYTSYAAGAPGAWIAGAPVLGPGLMVGPSLVAALPATADDASDAADASAPSVAADASSEEDNSVDESSADAASESASASELAAKGTRKKVRHASVEP